MPDFGDDIDWKRAWRRAENYDTNDFEWVIQYKEWLIRSSPEAGNDSFKIFLAETSNSTKYEQYVRRVWRIGLLKAVLRQLGKSQGEQWIQRLIDEQVANKAIPDHPYYDSFGAVLDHYWEHICRECSKYSQPEPCRTCNRCENCCKCYANWQNADEKRLWVLQTARQLLEKHGLSHWNVSFNNRKRSVGLCYFNRKTIELSSPFVDNNDEEEIRETILHEIAHALVGPEHGHDQVWMSKALEIGAKPLRCCPDANIPGRWQATCVNCGRTHYKHRPPKRGLIYHCKCNQSAPALTWRELA